MTYTIDDYPPQNFTIANPASIVNDVVGAFRILQTPSYPLGQHHFHLVFHGSNESAPFVLDQIIIQNSTSHVSLQSFPATLSALTQPTTSAMSAQPPHPTTPEGSTDAHRQSHLAIGIGISAGIIVAFLLISGRIWYHRRKQRAPVDHADVVEVVVRPFALSNRPLNIPEKSSESLFLQSGRNLDHQVLSLATRPIAVVDHRVIQDESNSTVMTAPPAYDDTQEAS